MSVLLTTGEALLLKALASGTVRIRLKRKYYAVRRVLKVTSFGFTAVLETRSGRMSEHEIGFDQFETSQRDLMKWLEANGDRLDDHVRELHALGVRVRQQ